MSPVKAKLIEMSTEGQATESGCRMVGAKFSKMFSKLIFIFVYLALSVGCEPRESVHNVTLLLGCEPSPMCAKCQIVTRLSVKTVGVHYQQLIVIEWKVSTGHY